jgi:hypothetical protein
MMNKGADMKPKVYVLHTDPGHGWLAVKHRELKELGIADRITRYSYARGTTAYLEEDCDLATFFSAYHARHGQDPQYRTSYREHSAIRSFDPYRVEVDQ